MKVRFAALALLTATTLGAGAARAQSFEYAPGAARYKIVSQQKMTQEAMGQKQDVDVNGEQVISVNVGRKAKDTLSLAVSLDSIAMTNSMMGAMDMSKAKGTKVSSLISPLGVVYSSAVPDSGQAAEIGAALVRVLPRVIAGLKAGATWTDTSTTKQKTGGLDIERTTIGTNKVVGDTTIDGEKALKIERTNTSKMSGTGSAQGQPISFEGTGNGSGTFYVTPKGMFVGADSKDDVKAKITMIANGMEIAMTMANTSKVSRIK